MNKIDLNYINSHDCELLVRGKLKQYFPMSLEYFDKSDLYSSDEVEWYQIIFPDIAYVPAGLVCFQDKDGDNTLHLSVLEVSKPCRNNGRGTEIMKKLIHTATQNNYHYMTLQLREPGLSKFYSRFGFNKRTNSDGLEYYELQLNY